MKRMKKAALLLIAVLVTGLFAGCGSSFDASAYIKALMDNSYKNDSAGIVEQKIATAEEAAEIYQQGLDAEMQGLLEGATLSEELQAEYRAVFEKMFKLADYTVGESEKKEDGSYVVTVNYKQLKVFEPAFAAYQVKVEELLTQWQNLEAEEEVPTEEEMLNTVYAALKDCMDEALNAPEYTEEASATVRVDLVNKVYTPNQDDLYGLESLLFDIEAAANFQ